MKKQQSIQRRLHSSYLFIVGLLSVPTILLLLFLLPTTARYHQHINYISDARAIVDLSGARLESELWDIVAGNQAYQAGAQEHIMDEISTRLDRLLYETEIYESRQQVEAGRTLLPPFGHVFQRADPARDPKRVRPAPHGPTGVYFH